MRRHSRSGQVWNTFTALGLPALGWRVVRPRTSKELSSSDDLIHQSSARKCAKSHAARFDTLPSLHIAKNVVALRQVTLELGWSNGRARSLPIRSNSRWPETHSQNRHIVTVLGGRGRRDNRARRQLQQSKGVARRGGSQRHGQRPRITWVRRPYNRS